MSQTELLFPKPAYRKERLRRKAQMAKKRSAACEAALKRDGRCMAHCCPCKTDSDPLARILDPHHIKPLGQGGPDEPGNIITLCRKYAHEAVTNGTTDHKRGRITAYQAMWETLAPYWDTLDWRWSVESWEWIKARL